MSAVDEFERRVIESLEFLHQKHDDLHRGHNGLVELLRTLERIMSQTGDAIRAADGKVSTLIQLVGNLINKINNGPTQLDPDAQQALDQLNAHLDQLTAEANQGEGDTAPAAGAAPAGDGAATDVPVEGDTAGEGAPTQA